MTLARVGPEEFRKAGHELVDWVADYRLKVAGLPVRSSVAPGEVRAALPTALPEAPEPLAALIADLDRVIVPGLTHVQHPRNFAWFPSNAALSSVLGDIVAGGLGALGISWQSAPALTELEQVVCDWARQLCGLSDGWSGTIYDGASTASLVALLVAREAATGGSQRRGGLQAEEAPLTVYCSADAHSSVTKAALLAGYGEDNLRLVPVSEARPRDGRRRPRFPHGAGRCKWPPPDGGRSDCGDDGNDSVRPPRRRLRGCSQVRRFCPRRRGNGWLGDAAAGMPGPVRRHRGRQFARMEPPQVVGVHPGDLALLRPRPRPAGLGHGYRPELPAFGNGRLGRPVPGLGPAARAAVQGAPALGAPSPGGCRGSPRPPAARPRATLSASPLWSSRPPGWEVVTPVKLQTVCVLHTPPGCDGEALDQHTLSWCEAVNASGQAHLTPALVDGHWVVRVSIGAEATEWDDIDQLWAVMQEQAVGLVTGRA